MNYCLGLLLAVVVVCQACYDFKGNSYLEFSPSGLSISHRVHYSLKFQTREPAGIILYSEGDHDYEGLFVHNGQLVYLLTNPSQSGVEGTTGAFYRTSASVNTGAWFTVEVWRNWQIQKRAPLSGMELRTGIVLYDEAGNRLETHTDNLNHRNVILHPTIYVGGISSSVVHARGSPIPAFKGQVKDMKKEGNNNNINFRSYSRNYEGLVKECS
ncbi:uncharacterized protein LOC143293807 [Babylonia areolata]|uniref:uncharacterized protein LOC143293807 n=1 Tax=Babylonia areolata TaxID=304850 RepID=UPI003FD607A0